MTPSPATIAALRWQALPGIPDAVGFGGSYAGLSGQTLLAGGGANFPGRKPWEGGAKAWHDRVFALTPGAAAWREAGRLPQPAGYGASLSLPEGVLLIGGGNAQHHLDQTWCARWDGRAVGFDPLPRLPVPLAMTAAALAGRVVYVAGGLEKPDAAQASAVGLSLDLDHVARGWRRLPLCPGPERFFATGGSDGTSFYLFGGARLVPGVHGRPQREWLRDAWRFTPGQGWMRLADLPRAAVAAPSPSPWVRDRLLVLGGDDGAQVSATAAEHRGFSRDILAYDPRTDGWTRAGEMPFSLVTTPAVVTATRLFVAGGETRPGIRSPEVWTTELP